MSKTDPRKSELGSPSRSGRVKHTIATIATATVVIVALQLGRGYFRAKDIENSLQRTTQRFETKYSRMLVTSSVANSKQVDVKIRLGIASTDDQRNAEFAAEEFASMLRDEEKFPEFVSIRISVVDLRGEPEGTFFK